MERLTTIDTVNKSNCLKEECLYIALSKNTHTLFRNTIDRLAEYEDTGLTPDEIESVKAQSLINAIELSKMKQERDYWEHEAKKWADKLGNIRIWEAEQKCERCQHEDTSKCKKCINEITSRSPRYVR